MNKNEVLLSIIVPVYNVEEYLEECLDSLVSQDIPHKEYEIVCIDDGSTDKSGEILDFYAKQYPNIMVVHKENGGVSSARNRGIDIAKGQYIWFIDADDFIKQNCLSAIKPKIIENKYDTIRILIYSFNHGESQISLSMVTPDMCQRAIKNFSVTYILKRSNIINNKIHLDPRISYAEDAIFMLQVIPFIKNAVTIRDLVIYFYRQRPGSATSQDVSKKISSRLYGALVCEEIIQGKRVGDVEGAYRFKYISVVKIIELIFKLSKPEQNKIIDCLKSNNLFPLKYSPKYTPKFRQNKTSLVKKIRNTLIDFSYMQIGLIALKLYYFILSLYKKRNRIKIRRTKI